MNLHKNILYYISFINIYLPLTSPIRNRNLVATNSGLEEISPCSIGLQFFSILNNTSEEDYFVELIADECCIHSDDDIDCDSVQIIGETSQILQKGRVKSFSLVAPVLDPYERKGYCVIHVDSRPTDHICNVMRDTIKINFDTGLNDKIAGINSIKTIRKCRNIDEDPFNNCEPVNCDTYYNGNKPIYNNNTKRCIKVPKCTNVKSELSKIYDPISNRCFEGEPVDDEDIDYIKSIAKDVHLNDVIIVESSDPPFDYSSDVIHLNSDIINKTKINSFHLKSNYICASVLHYVTTNKYTLFVLGMVIFVQCCFICTMIYCITKRSIRKDNKTVERKYFNYRQDVSVTTPLIGTSNIDTETTGFDFVSESSKIDKKMKCYKACQKERQTDPKIGMSDDILSKCLTRRDWNTKTKSDTTADAIKPYTNESTNAQWNAIKSNIRQTTLSERHSIKNNINEETEKDTSEESVEDLELRNRTRKVKEDYDDSDSSEKLIQCHDYNMVQSKRNMATTGSVSTEKGAQACFSNDSIDDFLSGRGMIFLAGETLSKYSFGSNSTPNSADRSSKTSKNNIVKDVLSYLSKKSKKYTSSDPGVKKSRSKDLELIHMSQASMRSSSASEYKNTQGLKLAKDSRSSF